MPMLISTISTLLSSSLHYTRDSGHRHEMESADTVLGHYRAVGSSLQPLLSGSSGLFKAVVEDDVGHVAALGSALDAEVTRLHNVLHWTSADEQLSNGTETSPESSMPTTTRKAPGVAVKARTLLMLAAYHSAQSGRLQVLKFLLGVKGADPRQRSPDGMTAAEMAKQVGGDAEAEVLALLQAAADSPAPPPALGVQHTASLNNSASSSRLDPTLFSALAPGQNTSAGEIRDLSGFSEATTCVGPASSASDQGSTVAASAGGFPISVDLQHHLSLQQVDGGCEADGLQFSSDGLPYSTSELTQPEFSTDEFRMFAFKVLRCSKRFAHDWRACPFAHPTENARRRDPREFRYCAIACPDYKQGFCVRGDLCPYAHGVFEAWLHPSRYRTQLCKDGANCHRPICFFAHSLPELRTPTHTWTPGAEDVSAVPVTQPAPALDSMPVQMRQVSKPATRPVRGSNPDVKSADGQPYIKGMDGSLGSGVGGGAAGASAPGSMAAMFGFTAPRMSNAFARRHGLNPKDNAMLNLQKIALQAQQTTFNNGGELGHVFHTGTGVVPNTLHSPHNDYGQQVGMGMYSVRNLGGGTVPQGMHGKTAQVQLPPQYNNIPLGQVGSSVLLQPGYSYTTPNGLMAMQAVAAATAHDPSLAALNHHLASLNLHPTAAAAAAAYAASHSGLNGYHDGHA